MTERLNRRKLVQSLTGSAPDALFVAGLGSPAWDLASTGDSERYFYLWGGMGQAVCVGLGLATAQPSRRVIVITGDGEMLMGLTSLIATGAAQPQNLGILVLDNETYGETGGQASATRGQADLIQSARAAGIEDSALCPDFAAAMPLITSPGPVFRLAKIRRQAAPLAVPPRDGAFLKDRLRGELGL